MWGGVQGGSHPAVKTVGEQGAVAEWNMSAPAARIGEGDQVLEVDGASTAGKTADDLRHMLTGPVSTTVVLLLASAPGTPGVGASPGPSALVSAVHLLLSQPRLAHA